MDSRREQNCGLSGPLSLPDEIKRLPDFLLRYRLVDADIAYPGQKRDIDFIATVLLVMVHQFYQLRIIIAGKG